MGLRLNIRDTILEGGIITCWVRSN